MDLFDHETRWLIGDLDDSVNFNVGPQTSALPNRQPRPPPPHSIFDRHPNYQASALSPLAVLPISNFMQVRHGSAFPDA